MLLRSYFAKVFALALAYYIAGRVALLLAIPPGYATAVWPSAGIAITGLLIWGYRVWPGILIGHFLVNLWTGLDLNSSALIIKSCSIAFGIALGGSLQAFTGAYLIRQFVGFPTTLTQEKDIFKLLLFGGPISCLLGSTLGVFTLWIFNIISNADCLFSWWTWWVGDTIGVMVVTPIALTWSLKEQEVSNKRKLLVTTPLLILFITMVIAFKIASTYENQRIQFEFEKRTEEIAHIARSGFNYYVDMIEAIVSFYAASQSVERDEFTKFVEHTFSVYTGMRALEWIPRITNRDRAAFEKSIQEEGNPDFHIWTLNNKGQKVPSENHHDFFPILYAEPAQKNHMTLGFDLGAESVRRKTLESARDTGATTISAGINLIQNSEHKLGFIIAAPIYKNESPRQTLDERRENLQGFALGVFEAHEVMESLLNGLDHNGINIQLHDRSHDGKKELLYSSFSQPEKTKKETLQNEITFNLLDHPYSFQFAANKTYMTVHRSMQAWGLLAGGLFLTSLFGALLLVITGRTAQIEQTVNQRTLELKQAHIAREKLMTKLKRVNQELNDFAYVVSHDLKAPLRGIDALAGWIVEDYHDKLDDNGKEYLNKLSQRVKRMQALINGILEYSRIERTQTEYEQVNLNQLFQDIVESLAPPPHIHIEKTQELPALTAQKIRIHQVFQNLLSNAIKFIDKPEGLIQAGCEDEGEAWRFYIRDNGPGIEPRHFERIFHLFQTLQTNEGTENTGVGLALVKKIIEQHKGKIWIESEPGKGSTFFFTLPKVGSNQDEIS